MILHPSRDESRVLRWPDLDFSHFFSWMPLRCILVWSWSSAGGRIPKSSSCARGGQKATSVTVPCLSFTNDGFKKQQQRCEAWVPLTVTLPSRSSGRANPALLLFREGPEGHALIARTYPLVFLGGGLRCH